MKQFFFTVIMLYLFTAMCYSQQPYWWELKQSGSSLGGPIDYDRNNTDIVYYGTGNVIYKSTDRGETFHSLLTSVPGSSEIKCVLVNDNDDQTLLVASESSPNDKIYKTTNDGVTWALTLNEGQMSYFGIPMTQDPTHPDTIYTMIDANFKRSTDFGSTWTTIASNFGPITAPCDIEVFPDTSIILIGDNGTGIFKSTDYGSTWSQKYNTSGEIPTIAVDFTHPGIAWATKWSGGGGLLKSTNYGESWSSVIGFNSINMWAVHIQETNGNVVMANCYSCGDTWRSINGGLTWTTIPITPSGYQVVIVDSITQYDAQSGGFYKLESDYFVPVELTAFSSEIKDHSIMLLWTTATELNNNGFEIDRSYNNKDFQKIGFVPGFGTTTQSKSYSYKIDSYKKGIQYYRLKQIDYDGSFKYYNSIEVDGLAPAEFSLSQNFPNPFNPSTKIKYTIPTVRTQQTISVKLKVYDIIGNEVATLVNKDEPAGEYETEFDGSKLPSGIYFYRLQTDNGFAATKDMVLLK